MLTPTTLTAHDLEKILADAIASGRDGTTAAFAVEREAHARVGLPSVQHYVLAGREPVAASLDDYIVWRKSAGWPHRIAATEVGLSLVSTEFLGADPRVRLVGPPVLFQTTVFSDDQDFDGLQWTARGWSDAQVCHARVAAALADGHEAVAALLDELAT